MKEKFSKEVRGVERKEGRVLRKKVLLVTYQKEKMHLLKKLEKERDGHAYKRKNKHENH